MILKRPLDGALHMFSKGLKVFPLKPNSKLPAFEDWQTWAVNATEKSITDFGTANRLHNWGVFASGSGLAILDIDNKKDKKGFESLKKLCDANEKLPKTFIVVTPAGGKHLYYKGEIQNSAGVLGEGLDTRGHGGYVVAPGSRIEDRAYEIDIENEIADLPIWIKTKLSTIKEKKIIDENEIIIEGQRNATLASRAGAMRAAGFDYEAMVSALLIFNEKSVSPPLPRQEIEQIAASISRYKPQDAKTAADFMELPRKENTFLASSIIEKDIQRRKWILKDKYVGGFFSVLVSRGGVGKSTLALLDAISICTGQELSGHDVTFPGGVWVYITEDPRAEIQRRVCAMAKHYEISLEKLSNLHLTSGRDEPLVLAKSVKDGVAINQKAIDHIIAYIKQHNIQLLVLDPFVKIHSVNENDNMQIDKVVNALNKIAEATKAAICVIHHEKKSGKNGPISGDAERSRGASALLDAARVAHTIDTMSEEEAGKFGIHPDKRHWYVKVSDAKSNLAAPSLHDFWFERKSIELDNGEFVGSLEKIDIKSKARENHEEQIVAQRKDIAYCLAQAMEIGDEIPINEARDILLTDPKHSHLFGTALNGREKAYKTIITALKTRPYFNDKIFTYRHDPKKKPSRVCVCEGRPITDAFI